MKLSVEWICFVRVGVTEKIADGVLFQALTVSLDIFN